MSIRDKIAKAPASKLGKRKNIKSESSLLSYDEGSFVKVPVEVIKPNPYQPRQEFNEEALKELSDSIKEKGVLQPVIVRQGEKNDIYLVAGERRLRASKKAGLDQIPAVFTKGHPAEIALIENLQREDLNPIDEAEAYSRMINEFDYTQEHLGHLVGKARNTITEILALNKLPKEIKEESRRADIYPRRLLLEVAKQKTPQAMTSLFKKVKSGNLNSTKVREITRKSKITRTPASIAIDKTHTLNNHLAKLDLNTVSDNEKNTLMTELNNLKRLLDKFLG